MSLFSVCDELLLLDESVLLSVLLLLLLLFLVLLLLDALRSFDVSCSMASIDCMKASDESSLDDVDDVDEKSDAVLLLPNAEEMLLMCPAPVE